MDLAIVPFAVPSSRVAIGLVTAHGRPLVLIAIAAIAILVLLRNRPLLAGGSCLRPRSSCGWPLSFVASIELHAQVHPDQSNALIVPVLRWLAVPFAVIGAFARQWDLMVLAGSASFLVFLFMDRWASLGYLLAAVPITGIALEERWRRHAA